MLNQCGLTFPEILCPGPRPYGSSVFELTFPSFLWGLECGRCLNFSFMQTQCASLGTYTWELALTRVSPKKTCHIDPTAQACCCSRLWGRRSKMLCLMIQGTHRMGLGWCTSQHGKKHITYSLHYVCSVHWAVPALFRGLEYEGVRLGYESLSTQATKSFQEPSRQSEAITPFWLAGFKLRPPTWQWQ